MADDLLQAALGYAARGWYVFPLAPLRKTPATEHGFKDATLDPEQIRAWWAATPDANVGIAAGASGLVVLDLDVKSGAPGLESWAVLTARVGAGIADTLKAYTPSGGRHFYYSAQGDPIGNSASKLGDGLDVRGVGGYVVAPPSRVPGAAYQWVNEDAPLLPFPNEIATLLMPRPQADTPARPRLPFDDTAGYWLDKALAQARPGKRNEVGFWLACQLRDAGLQRAEAETVLLDYAARVPQGGDPYTVGEALAALQSAYSGGRREPARGVVLGAVLGGGLSGAAASPIATASPDELRARLSEFLGVEIVRVVQYLGTPESVVLTLGTGEVALGTIRGLTDQRLFCEGLARAAHIYPQIPKSVWPNVRDALLRILEDARVGQADDSDVLQDLMAAYFAEYAPMNLDNEDDAPRYSPPQPFRRRGRVYFSLRPFMRWALDEMCGERRTRNQWSTLLAHAKFIDDRVRPRPGDKQARVWAVPRGYDPDPSAADD